MKRALNNTEKSRLKELRDLGYTPEVKETLDHNKEPSYYAEVTELKAWIALGSRGSLSHLPTAQSSPDATQTLIAANGLVLDAVGEIKA